MVIRRFGIFGKVFLYTMIFLLLAISVTAAVFAQQFKDFYDYLQVRQYTAAFEPLKLRLSGNEDPGEIIQMANEFHSKNQFFAFNIETKDGIVIYRTLEGSDIKAAQSVAMGSTAPATRPAVNIVAIKKATDEIIAGQVKYKTSLDTYKAEDGIVISLNNDFIVRSLTETDTTDLYHQFSNKVFLIAFFLLCSSIAGALLFARGITNPIKKLAEDTRKMAGLEPVPVPQARGDEVGQLTADVHNMYEKLKQTISRLETEILREKEMEENQRYFFSAASHELKTPIAATSALLEGMLANIGDYKNHPKYLRECLHMMNAQNRTITEILEIVSLSDERIAPQKEDVNLSEVIEDLLPEYYTLAEKKNQNVKVHVLDTVICQTDRKMLARALSNILMNAIQNSPDGEEIQIWSEPGTDGTVRLCVLNTNASIEEEAKAKLFEPFYRADMARSRKDERSGLGLTIVKRILDSMDIPFELATVNSGVMFWLELPAK